MPIAFVQKKQATNTTGTSIAVTLDAAPTQGNLVVGTIASNDGSFTNPTGYDTSIEVYNATDDDILRIFHKIAGAGESATLTSTGFPGNTKHAGASEWSGIDNADPLDVVASTGVTLAATSISSGTTATTSTPESLAIAEFAIRAATTAESVNNSFSLLNVGDGTFSDFSGSRIYATTATANTTGSWTTAGTAWAGIAVYNAAPPTSANNGVKPGIYYTKPYGAGGSRE